METRYRNTGAPTKTEENGMMQNKYGKYTNGNYVKTNSHQNGFKKSTTNGHSLKVKVKTFFFCSDCHTLCEKP